VLVGTPLYLSPESIATPDEVEARSDLYSLGSVGYFLLTGQPLFEGRTVMELCAHHLHTPPTPPSVRLGRVIDAALEAVLLRCLAKSPSERPASALALDDELAACAAAGDWGPADARRWWTTHRAVVPTPPPASRLAETDTVAVDLAMR
jgi:serine/threonine-protein kinase